MQEGAIARVKAKDYEIFMVKRRTKIPPDIILSLVKEAGMKCANPGCYNYRTHIHHIQEWHVYQTHNKDHMIAVCPSCHDAIHHSKLRIKDETVYRWKGIKRAKVNQSYIYVEPGNHPKILLGSIAITSHSDFSVFELSSTNQLNFCLIDKEILHINLKVTTISGLEVIRVIANHVTYADNILVHYEQRPGRFCLTGPPSEEFIPRWALNRFRHKQDVNYATNGNLTLLELEVLEPGLVKVQGVWAEDHFAVIITENLMAFDTPQLPCPIALCGAGADSVLFWAGLINSSLFGFKSFPYPDSIGI